MISSNDNTRQDLIKISMPICACHFHKPNTDDNTKDEVVVNDDTNVDQLNVELNKLCEADKMTKRYPNIEEKLRTRQ